MIMNNPYDSFLQYMEYLYSMGCTLDENGNVVPIDNNKKEYTLTLTIKEDDDEDE